MSNEDRNVYTIVSLTYQTLTGLPTLSGLQGHTSRRNLSASEGPDSVVNGSFPGDTI
jgi:hypothetical protein